MTSTLYGQMSVAIVHGKCYLSALCGEMSTATAVVSIYSLRNRSMPLKRRKDVFAEGPEQVGQGKIIFIGRERRSSPRNGEPRPCAGYSFPRDRRSNIHSLCRHLLFSCMIPSYPLAWVFARK